MRLGIRAKLFAGFGAVLILLGIVGAVGYRNTVRSSEQFTDLYESRLQPVLQLANVQLALYELRLGALAYGTADAAGRSAIKADTAKYLKIIDDQMTAYAATYLVPEETQGLSAWRRSYPAYLQAREKVLALTDQNKLDEANAIRNGEATRLFSESRTAVNDLISIQDRVGAEMKRASEESAAFAIKLLLGASVLALIIGFGAGLVYAAQVIRVP